MDDISIEQVDRDPAAAMLDWRSSLGSNFVSRLPSLGGDF